MDPMVPLSVGRGRRLPSAVRAPSVTSSKTEFKHESLDECTSYRGNIPARSPGFKNMETLSHGVLESDPLTRGTSSTQQPPSQATEKIRHCPYCSREFKKNDHYERHLRSHTNEKPYGCSICGKFYPRRDTLLRHLKTHKVRHRRQGNSRSTNRVNTAYSHRGSPTTAMDDRGSMILPPASSLGSDLELEDATFDLTIAGNDGRSTVRPHSFHDPQPHQIAKPPGVLNGSEQHLLGRTLDRGTALLSGASTSTRSNSDLFSSQQIANEDQSAMDDSAFGDPILHFDPSNWLLDDSLVDLGLGDFAWNEPLSPNDRTQLRFQPISSTKGNNTSPTVLDLRQIWYTQTPRTVDSLRDDNDRATRQVPTTLSNDIDEIYRGHMDEELSAPLRNEPLPSIDFLNLCIHLFFTRFNTALPLIHAPTFRPSENNIFLVLTMCCIGATTMTSGMATRVGSMIFERTHKAGNRGQWERGLSERPHLTRDNIKGAIIGQTFALISGDAAHRTIADAYHGCIISLGRHVGLFSELPELDLLDTVSAEDLEKRWKQWARNEEMRRSAMVLHIQDAELTALFHHEPAFRHSASRLPHVAPTDLFQAPSAAVWAMKYSEYRKSRHDSIETRPSDARPSSQPGRSGRNQVEEASFKDNRQGQSVMNSWAALSGIGATICEYRHLRMFSPPHVTHVEADLVAWYTLKNCCKVESCQAIQHPELPFCLRPLWHYTFMTLSADMDLIEVAVGRDGPNIPSSKLELVRAWISSQESKRCLLHALLLQNLVKSTSVDSAIAIHTPRILFSAAICWYCFILYSPWCAVSFDSGGALLLDEASEYLTTLPEIQLLKERNTTDSVVLEKSVADLRRILGANPVEVKASTLCVLQSALRRLGTSGISQKFADIVQAFITGASQ